MDGLLQDLRYALRALRRAPGFTLAAVVTLALGIGGTSTIFSVLNALLLRPLPVREPARLVELRARDKGGTVSSLSFAEVSDLRAASAPHASLAAYSMQQFTLNAGADPEPMTGALVTENYFEVLGVAPAAGRFFTGEEGRIGAGPVAVLSWDLWQRRFGGDAGVVGRTIRLNGQAVPVVGVAPRGFHGTLSIAGLELFVPVTAYAQLVPGAARGRLENRGHRWLRVFGRLDPGVSMQTAAAALDARARAIGRANPRPQLLLGVATERLHGLPRGMRQGLAVVGGLLLATALLVLLIASVNVAGMLLARATARRREVAIRLAMGAGRGRLVRQLLTESAVLWLLGGAAGVVLTTWLAGALPALVPPMPHSVRLALDVRPDARVVAFALLLSLATGMLFGLAPALQATRPDLVGALRETSGPGRRGSRLRDAFVVGQIAASVLLLVGAGLFLRTVRHSWTADPGFDPDGVVGAQLDPGLHGYTDARAAELYRRLEASLRATPGVTDVAMTTLLPLSGMEETMRVRPDGRAAREEGTEVGFSAVTPGFFGTLRVPVLRGRTFAEADRAGTPAVAVVSREAARRLWPGQDPLGRRISTGGPAGPWAEVVGVVDDLQAGRLGEAPSPFVYFPHAQSFSAGANLLVRTSGDPGAALGAVRRELRALDPDLPLMGATELRTMIAVQTPQRLIATFLSAFGAVGLVLAAVGLYGVVAYLVARRTHEIGIRVALGAVRRDVVGLVLRQGVGLAAAGVAVGSLLAALAMQPLASFLPGVAPLDPLTFAGVAILLSAVTLLACWVPAVRAARVDPIQALRTE